MKKIACVLLALSLLLIVLPGCKGESADTGAVELTVEKVAEMARAHLEATEHKDAIGTITNFDSPSVEIVDGCYGSEGREVWKVVFNTKQDAFLGPITLYLDKYTGHVLWQELRY